MAASDGTVIRRGGNRRAVKLFTFQIIFPIKAVLNHFCGSN